MKLAGTVTVAALALATFLGLTSGESRAMTIDAVEVLGGTVRGEITCSGSCAGLVAGATGALSTSEALIYDKTGSAEPADVAAMLNSLAGTSFTTGIRTNMGNGVLANGDTDEDASFTSSALWVAFKLGNNFTFVKNTGLGSLDYLWEKTGSGGFGLSNITEFGVTPVPLPAAGWMLIGGLAGLGYLSRRKARA